MGLLGFLTGVSLLRRLVRIVLLLLLAVVVYLAVTAVQVWLTSRQNDPHQAQAIVVMGSAEYNGRPSPDLAARLDEALLLWRAGFASHVVVTGSKMPGDVYTEAGTSARYLEADGVPATDITEVGGRDSWANLADAAAVLVPAGQKDVLIVTDPFHEDRSMAIATDVGLTPSPTPTQTSPIRGWSTAPYFAKETVGVALGRIFGYSILHRLHTFA